MKILITGGAGYIGTELVHKLASDQKIDEIIVYDNLSRKNYNLFLQNPVKNGKVKFIYGDILDSRKIRQTLVGVDVVYHLAARVSTPFASQDPHFFEQTNHWGTAEIVYAIEESKSVKQFIYVSSASVYGSSKDEASEDTLPNPRTYYGISKLRAEEHVTRLMKKLNTIIIRLGNVYGFSPSMRFDAVINKFMFEANYNGKININGSGKQTRAFIHIQKVEHVLAELLNNTVPSGIYNLIDKNLSIEEIAFTIKEIYPALDMLYVNQHLSLREMRINRNGKVNQLLEIPETNLLSELLKFKESFSFHPSSVSITSTSNY